MNILMNSDKKSYVPVFLKQPFKQKQVASPEGLVKLWESIALWSDDKYGFHAFW